MFARIDPKTPSLRGGLAVGTIEGDVEVAERNLNAWSILSNLKMVSML